MKLVVFCLFAVFCSSLAVALPEAKLQRNKLQEILRLVDAVKTNLQNSELQLNTPPKNIEDCCSLSALDCFQASLQEHFNISEKYVRIDRSLKSKITKKALNFCDSGNVNSTCQDCASHPQTSATEFFNRLETFIQNGIDRQA